jgi:TetR/AcrR family transcriptional regulator, lmrAB and yxaGH operons repressor
VSARDRLIAATVGQVRRHGVAGTSVSGILDDSGLARRTLYLNFPNGKPELVAAATELAARATISAFDTMLSEPDPVRLVETFVDTWADTLDSTDFSAGCPIVAAALGRQEAPDAADAAGAAFAEWVRVLTRIGEDSGLGREAAEEMATMIVATVEGAVVMSIAERSSAPLRRAGRGLVGLVRAKLAEDTERPTS